jgi:ubiquinone biosynthesis UbiH/UbiF/VisC/COQ6 family hydroxylase
MPDYKPAAYDPRAAAFDLVVVGGGPVGASLARAARGLSVALVAHERRRPAPQPPGAYDARVYALSPGNVAFLSGLRVWRAIPEERLAPVHAMRIYGDDGASRLEFDAYRAGVPALAWIVEDGALQDALWRDLDVDVLAAPISGISFAPDAAKVASAREGAVAARLVVGADGANSLVRRAAGIEAAQSDYGQSAVVANFRCEKPHANTAFQWFLGPAVLALLPLPGDQVSMVWSLPRAEAARIAALDARAICAEVQAASRHQLGGLELSSAIKSYPLQRLSAQRLVAPRVALAGDAGHVIHPLAGQGLNLGLQDARVLAQTLAAREPGRDPGDLRLLRRYARARAEPILAMDGVVDGLYSLFGASGPLAARLRNAGLNLTERMPVLKNVLVRHAMR